MDSEFANHLRNFDLVDGIRLAGILQGLVLVGFVQKRVRDKKMGLLPIAYTISLIAGFLVPLLYSTHSGGGVAGLFYVISASLPALGYLLIMQLVSEELPDAKHFAVLIAPALAILIYYGIGLTSEGSACAKGDLNSCALTDDYLRLFEILSGGAVLLVLMFVIRNSLPAIEDLGLGRERRALIQTIIALMAALMAFDLARLFGLVGAYEAGLIGAVLRLTFFYLVASSIFRVFPTAFHLPEPELPAREVKRLNERKTLTPEEDAQLKRIGELMNLDKLYQEPGFSRKQLADELEIPEHQLSRIINTGFGQSFTDLINHHRVEEAKQLLSDTEQPVSQIAFDVGFNSLASFNRVFKTSTDLSPTAYRKKAQGRNGDDTGKEVPQQGPTDKADDEEGRNGSPL